MSIQYFPYLEQENKWCHCVVGFVFGLALRQTSALCVPRRGSSSHGASSASGKVFYFTLIFFSTLLIKAEIGVFKGFNDQLFDQLLMFQKTHGRLKVSRFPQNALVSQAQES